LNDQVDTPQRRPEAAALQHPDGLKDGVNPGEEMKTMDEGAENESLRPGSENLDLELDVLTDKSERQNLWISIWIAILVLNLFFFSHQASAGDLKPMQTTAQPLLLCLSERSSGINPIGSSSELAA
jgi:hypothetical protein